VWAAAAKDGERICKEKWVNEPSELERLICMIIFLYSCNFYIHCFTVVILIVFFLEGVGARGGAVG